MSTLAELIAKRSPESQKRIHEMTKELLMDYALQQIRQELELSQAQVAEQMGVSQPAVAKIESKGKDITLNTLTRYVEALGGRLSLQISLPTGQGRVIPIR